MNIKEAAIQALESFTILGSDGKRIETPELVQYISPKIAHGAMNAVVRARFDLPEMDHKIDETLKPYEELKRNCWWMVGPNSLHQIELEQKLLDRGFELEHEGLGLSIETKKSENFEVDSSITVEKVGFDRLEEYLITSLEDGEVNDRYRSYFEYVMKKNGDAIELFLVRINGEAAGTGVIQYLDGVASLTSSSVKSKYRGRGAYRALVKYRLSRLREKGIPQAVVLSKAHTSGPILLKMGFEKVFSFNTLEKIATQ